MRSESEDVSFTDVNLVISRRLASAFGWDPQMVDAVTDAIVFELAKVYGGRSHYIGKRNGLMRQRMREDFNGRNIHELSRKYGVSCATVRRTVAKRS